jgi:hypothetical protein
MKGFVFDPRRLRGSRRQQEREGYVVARQLLRDYLGGDPLVEARRCAERDPVLRAMFAAATVDLALAAAQIEARTMEETIGDKRTIATTGEQPGAERG